MATYSTQEQQTIRNENLDIHHKRKENYKEEEREAKKSKFECGAKAVVDGTSMPFKTTAEKGDVGLVSLKVGNNITKKSTIPAEASSKEIIALDGTLKNQADWFSYDHKCIDDDEEESLAPSVWDAITLKGKENYKGEEREAKKRKTQSKFECGAKAVVDGTSKPSKTTAEKSDKGLGSPKAGNNITKKSTFPGEESLAELEEALKDEANWFSYDESAWLCISDEEEEPLAPDWVVLASKVPVIPCVERPPQPYIDCRPKPDYGECFCEWMEERVQYQSFPFNVKREKQWQLTPLKSS